MKIKVVIIGGMATGPKVGCRIKRLNPEADVVILETHNTISYGKCGIPFYISGEISSIKELMSTSYKTLRDKEFFATTKRIEIRSGHKVLKIDRENKKVHVLLTKDDTKYSLSYDFLVIATGSKPYIPNIKGLNLKNILPVSNIHNAQIIKELIVKNNIKEVAIIGAGPIGLELSEALVELWGLKVHIFEEKSQVLSKILDPEIARMLENHLNKQTNLKLHLKTKIESLLGDFNNNVTSIKASNKEYRIDLVLITTGFKPNVKIAKNAGLKIENGGGICVDETMRTNDPFIFAGGDCVSIKNLLSKEIINLSSGSLANQQGRIIGTNICGGKVIFKGTLAPFCIKLFNFSIACTGLNEVKSKKMNLKTVSPLLVQTDHAHFYPDSELIFLKLIVNSKNNKILGAVALGKNGDAIVGRINLISSLLLNDVDISFLSNLELAYSPPLGSAMDILNAAANVAENIISGKSKIISVKNCSDKILDKKNQTYFLDIRSKANAEPYVKRFGSNWINIPQEILLDTLKKVPLKKEIIVVCNSGSRSYEVELLLKDIGIVEVYNLNGGIASLKSYNNDLLS